MQLTPGNPTYPPLPLTSFSSHHPINKTKQHRGLLNLGLLQRSSPQTNTHDTTTHTHDKQVRI
eukprot:7792726-Prorocentrum_lima.AAC.1